MAYPGTAPVTHANETFPERRVRAPWWCSLSVRLTVGLVAVWGVFLLLAGLWLGRTEERRFRDQAAEHAAKTAAIVVNALSARMLAGGGAAVWNDVTRLSEEMRAVTGAERIVVLSRDGRVKATTDAALRGHRYDVGRDAECVECHTGTTRTFPAVRLSPETAGAQRLRIINPIPKQPACQRCHTQPEDFRGMIAVDFDYSPVEQATARRNRVLFWAGIASGLTLFALGVLSLHRILHRPLGALVNAATAFGDGNLEARVPVRRRDEIGQLAASFNRMAAQTEEHIVALARKNMEVDLLYTLVVEASRSMEITQIHSMVLKVVAERLPLKCVLFHVQHLDDWYCGCIGTCPCPGAQEDRAKICKAWWADRCPPLPGIPPAMVNEACRGRRERYTGENGEWRFVIPIHSADRLIGVLGGTGLLAEVLPVLDAELLSKLAAHVGLAIVNARNYTLAITDTLTGLRTRRYGLTHLEEAIYLAERQHSPLAVLLLDLDHFKQVNDLYGHHTGDRVLKEVAARLRRRARMSDILVRYGGEEFLIIMPDTDAANLETAAESLRCSISDDPVALGGSDRTLRITASFGGTLLRPGENSARNRLIERADRALYQAKAEGRNRVVIEKQS